MFGLSDDIVKELCEVFREHSNIDEVLIFGSRAKGNYSTGSDIDLAVKGHNISFRELAEISLQIEKLELLYKVDVLNYYEKIGTPIGAHIERVAQVFYRK